MKRTFVLYVLVFVLAASSLTCFLPVNSASAEAISTALIADALSRYNCTDGKYWTYDIANGNKFSGIGSDYERNVDSSNESWATSGWAGYRYPLGTAWPNGNAECAGFALFLGYVISNGEDPLSSGKWVRYSSFSQAGNYLQVGDIVAIQYNRKSGGTSTHMAMVYSANNGNYKFAQAAGGSNNKIIVDRAFWVSAIDQNGNNVSWTGTNTLSQLSYIQCGTYPNGVVVYRYVGEGGIVNPPDLPEEPEITGATYPNNLSNGNSFGLRGTITCKYTMTKVEAVLTNRATHQVITFDPAPVAANLSTNSYSLGSEPVNNNLIFGDSRLYDSHLNYSLIVTYVRDGISYEKKVIDHNFTIGNPGELVSVYISPSLEFGLGSMADTYTEIDVSGNYTDLDWSSSNTDVLRVSNGGLYGVGYGDAVLTATTTDDSSVYAQCNVSVRLKNFVSLGTLRNTGVSQISYFGGCGQVFGFRSDKTWDYTFYSTGNDDTYAILYDGSFNELARNDDSGEGNNFKISYVISANTAYYLFVRGYNPEAVSSVQMEGRRNILELPEDCECYAMIDKKGQNVCYSFVPTESCAYVFTSSGSQNGRGAWATLYDSSWNALATGNASHESADFTIEYNLTAGQTYYIDTGFADVYATGSFSLTNYRNGPATIARGTCGTSLTWKLYQNGELNISGTGAMDDANYEGSPWYTYRESIQSVVLENGVTSIGNYAFQDCAGLTNVTIPSSVTIIGPAAFYDCTNLTGVTIPSSVTTIGSSAFSGCENLTSITIPSSVTSIGFYAFKDCYNLDDLFVDSRNTAYSSQDGVLFNKNKTTLVCYPAGRTGSYTIPSGVTIIGRAAFYDCTNLTGVTIPSSVTDIGLEAFSHTSLSNPTIPSSVTMIGDYAFSSCYNLTSITIPSSVTGIGNSAFTNCTNLTGISVASGNPSYSSQDGVLFNKNKTTLICCPGKKEGVYAIPSSVTSISANAFWACANLTSITIPDGVTSIEFATFCRCTGMTSVTIPASVTSIESSAFFYCASLANVYYAGTQSEWNAISIGSNNEYLTGASIHCNLAAFGDCGIGLSWMLTGNGVLTISGTGDMWNYSDTIQNGDYVTTAPWGGAPVQVIVQEGVTSIGEWAFYGCSKLTSVTIQEGVVSIGYLAFGDCSSLTSVSLPSTLTTIGEDAFAGCAALPSIAIPSGVTSIGNGSFVWCYNLMAINVESGNPAYSSMNGVLLDKNGATLICFPAGKPDSYITIPSSVTRIENNAFRSCKNLTSIMIPQNVTEIIQGAFDECSNITDIYVASGNAAYSAQDGVLFNKNKTMLVRCPEGSSGVYTVPDSVTELSVAAFYNCRRITSITLPQNLPAISARALSWCTSLTSVTIPASVTSISSNAFYASRNLADIYFLGTKAQWDAITMDTLGNDPLLAARLHCIAVPDPTFILPASLTTIESEAFAGLPGSVVIRIHANVTAIADNAFTGTNVTLLVPAGSRWVQWAADRNIPCYEE